MTTNPRELWTNRTILGVMMVFTILPLLSMLSAALSPQGSFPVGLSWPSDPQWGNFAAAFESSKFPLLLTSSLMIAGAVVPATLLVATLAGFALGRLRVPGGTIVMLILLLGLTIPAESIITPLYFQMREYGLINTRWAIILPLIGAFIPFGSYWMRAHFAGLPDELDEAARVDGANLWQLFTRIHLPLAVPALSSLGLLVFLWSLNSFMIPLVMVDDPTQRTLAGALAAFQGEHVTDTVMLNAGALLIATPALLIFLAFQRQFIRGLLQGSIK